MKKNIYIKLLVNIIFNSELLEIFLFKIEIRWRCWLLLLLLYIVLEVLVNGRDKKNKWGVVISKKKINYYYM